MQTESPIIQKNHGWCYIDKSHIIAAPHPAIPYNRSFNTSTHSKFNGDHSPRCQLSLEYHQGQHPALLVQPMSTRYLIISVLLVTHSSWGYVLLWATWNHQPGPIGSEQSCQKYSGQWVSHWSTCMRYDLHGNLERARIWRYCSPR